MNECLLIFFSLRKESLLLTVVDMRDQCSERNLRISKSNCGKNHVDYTWLCRYAKNGCSRILLRQKLKDLMTENLSVIKPIYFRCFCAPSLFYLSTSQNLITFCPLRFEILQPHSCNTVFREGSISGGTSMGLYCSKAQSHCCWTHFRISRLSPRSNGNHIFNFALETLPPINRGKKKILSMYNYLWYIFYCQSLMVFCYLSVGLDLFKKYH